MRICLLIILLFLSACATEPSRVPASSTQLIQEAHETFQRRWLQSHDPKSFVKELEKLIQNPSRVGPKTFQHFKEMRKNANFYRISFSLYSVDGKVPKKFNSYVKHFGRLNDAIEYGHKEGIIKEAKWIKKWIKKNKPEKVGRNFKAISFSNFKKLMKNTLDDLEAAFRNKRYDQHTLHVLRKRFKGVLHVYFYNELTGRLNLDTYGRLLSFTDELGDIHDNYVKELLREGNTQDLEIIHMNANQRDKIFLMIKKIRHDFSGSKSCPSLLKLLFTNS